MYSSSISIVVVNLGDLEIEWIKKHYLLLFKETDLENYRPQLTELCNVISPGWHIFIFQILKFLVQCVKNWHVFYNYSKKIISLFCYSPSLQHVKFSTASSAFWNDSPGMVSEVTISTLLLLWRTVDNFLHNTLNLVVTRHQWEVFVQEHQENSILIT